MDGTILWALTTGFITGGVWVGIVLLRRQRRLSPPQPQQRLEEVENRLSELEGIDRRMSEVEERLDFAERLLTKEREEQRLSPPRS